MLRVLRGIGSFIFWEYERGSWQYDVKVALILAFIFLTPRGVFNDRPMLSQGRQVVEVRGADGIGYRVEAGVLEGTTRSLEVNAEHIVEQVRGRPAVIERIEPVLDERKRIVAYTIWIKDTGQ